MNLKPEQTEKPEMKNYSLFPPLPPVASDLVPLELQIIRASEFIRLGAQGHFDLAASKAAHG